VSVIVVGAGLAGLTAAHRIRCEGLDVRVLEARRRVGGRTWTVAPDDLAIGSRFDLGATWHWTDQNAVRLLARELGLVPFSQYRDGLALSETALGRRPSVVVVPPAVPGELRLAGGAQDLCLRLAEQLGPAAIIFDSPVTSVVGSRARLAVTVADEDAVDGSVTYEADFVVIAVPPRLASERIVFHPDLSAARLSAMAATPTAMARALKAVVVYDQPFWRHTGCSGLAFSTIGPLTEVHDGCTSDASMAALWGFVSPHHRFRDVDGATRAALVTDQLVRLFGSAAGQPVGYFERDWSRDAYTADALTWSDNGQAYGHPRLSEPAMGGRLMWAGSETEAIGGGHMEGAVRSGQRAADQVLEACGGAPDRRRSGG